MNCTTLPATTLSHHLPYLDISQAQEPYFELSKDLNNIHAYGTRATLLTPTSRFTIRNQCFVDGYPPGLSAQTPGHSWTT